MNSTEWFKSFCKRKKKYMDAMNKLSDFELIKIYNDYSHSDELFNSYKASIITQLINRGFDVSEISSDNDYYKNDIVNFQMISVNHHVKLKNKKLIKID